MASIPLPVATAASGSVARLGNSVSGLALSSTAASSVACSWTSMHSLLGSLLQSGRTKFRTVEKTLLQAIHRLQPSRVNQRGSHVVLHDSKGRCLTVVQPHAGRRSKDGTVSLNFYQALQHFGCGSSGPLLSQESSTSRSLAQPLQRPLPPPGSESSSSLRR